MATSSFAFSITKWVLNAASRLIKADVRVHNAEVIEDDMAIIFVVNHFTRLETLLLPYQLYQEKGLEVWSLAAGDLFVGRIGEYLRTMGTVSTKDPDRDKLIVHSLLKGVHPWIIFPEGGMIKDKKVVDSAGVFSVYNRDRRRPPHKGAAIMALRAEFYRHKIECIYESPAKEGLEETKEHFELESVEDVIQKRTVIIPINITYFPIRARENAVQKMARVLAKDLSERAIDELSVEGTILSSDTDIDITLGEPIDVRTYLNQPEYAELMACGDDLQKLEADPRSLFSEAADELMHRYMTEIYRLTRINYDHIFATLIRYQGTRPFTERRYRNRIFLCAYELLQRGTFQVHTLLEKTYKDIIYEDPSEKFRDFMDLCLKEGVIERKGDKYVKVAGLKRGEAEFHAIRSLETTYVIANEVEPLTDFTALVKRIAKEPKRDLSLRIRKIFVQEDYEIFERDYNEFKTEESRHMEVGRPFLIVPEGKLRGGVVLVHGYLAAPKEIRALANFLYDQGYAVYGVRLKGHGTSPEDLARTEWEEWYESVNRGYVIIKTLTDRVILGGFSTGGCLALIGAGKKQDKIHAAFSINAPLRLRQFTARFVPTVVTMSSLLKMFNRGRQYWEYVSNDPENIHINYKRNPLTGVRELSYAMGTMEEQLSNIVVPTLVVQSSKDPVVHPSSGPDIFDKIGTDLKELSVFERDNHGIINGEGSEHVFNRVEQFLKWASDKSPKPVVPEPLIEKRRESMLQESSESA